MKEDKREANVVVAKCKHSKKTYGIRMEKKMDGAWHCTWAFKINEKSAKNENYDTRVSGIVKVDEEYPGCPYCGALGWFSCAACGNLTCYEGNESIVTCAWCGNKGECEESDSFDLKGGGY